MRTTTTGIGCMRSINFHPNVPYLTRPKIISESIVDGVRMYFGEGTEYVADLFDAMFKTVRGQIKKVKGKVVLDQF